MTTSLSSSSLALVLLCSVGLAQRDQVADAERFSTPVHRGGEALWVARESFKASFDDGFTFYPLVGTERANAPLRWRTTAVTVGGIPVGGLPGLAAARVTDDRVEMNRGAWLEAYDVRGEGVEQTFVFHAPIRARGAMEITGQIQTGLEAAPMTPRHGGLLFRDGAGRPVISYGEAWVFDAAGARAPVATSWDGAEIRLHVSAEFMDRAVYPVTVDPLTSSVVVESSVEPIVHIDVATDPAGGAGSVLMVYSRGFAANDFDAYAAVADPAFAGSAVIFSDVSAAHSTIEGQCAWVGDAQRWAMTFEREHFTPATTSEILTYFHDRGAAALNSGLPVVLSKPAGTTARNPDIGGRAVGGGMNAFVVYQLDTTTTQANTANTEVFGVLVDASNGGVVSLTDLGWFASGTTYDREYPTVAQVSEGAATHWIVCWQEFFTSAPGDDWDVNLSRITFSGQKTAKLIRLGKSVHPWHKRFPQVAGGNGRFLVTYLFGAASSKAGDEIHTQRFDWPDSSGDPVVQPPQVLVAASTSASTLPDFAGPAIAHDTNTRSHWVITYNRRVLGDLFATRVGYTGGAVEANAIYTPSVGKGVTTAAAFSPAAGGAFPVIYSTDGPGGSDLVGLDFTYPAGAQNLLYGTGCSGQIAAGVPYAGSEFFSVSLAGAAPNAVAALAVAGQSANLNLGAAGATGCFLLLGSPTLWLPAAAGAGGDASVTLALPEGIGVSFDLYSQWAHVDVGANPLGVVTTAGLQSQVR